jgi:hypothetical protein
MFRPRIAPATIDRRIRKPKATIDETPRPTLARPVVRTELFGGWGPKL